MLRPIVSGIRSCCRRAEYARVELLEIRLPSPRRMNDLAEGAVVPALGKQPMELGFHYFATLVSPLGSEVIPG
jgi:hypothetical protein